jgi:hypothetical protein
MKKNTASPANLETMIQRLTLDNWGGDKILGYSAHMTRGVLGDSLDHNPYQVLTLTSGIWWYLGTTRNLKYWTLAQIGKEGDSSTTLRDNYEGLLEGYDTLQYSEREILTERGSLTVLTVNNAHQSEEISPAKIG